MKIVYRFCQLVVFLFFTTIFIGCTTLPDKKQTNLGLYLTSVEAYELVKQDAKNILFLDLRSNAEVVKLGKPALLDGHVQYLLRVRKEGKEKKFKFIPNDNFVIELEEQVQKKGLNRQSKIILICRNGNRSADAVNALAKVGYEQVYTVTDGTREGWKVNNLPWINQLKKGKPSS